MSGQKWRHVIKAALLLPAVVLLTTATSAAKYSGGTGEPNNPYRIATPNDLNDIANHVEDYNKWFILINDINMAGFVYTTALIAADTSTSSGFQGTRFTGVFDGNHCNISNLTIDTAGAGNDYLGLFGRIDQPAQVEDLYIEDLSIIGGLGSYYLGGLCGSNGDGLVSWSITSGGTVRNCYVTGSVSGGDYSESVGGLGGRNYGTISNCCATAGVSAGSSPWNLGGLVGFNWSGSITNCYATGQVSSGSGSLCLGGLVGTNDEGSISECYATGTICGYYKVGGLVAVNRFGSISKSWASGSVSGDDEVGGLVGCSKGSLVNCYATGCVSGQNDVGGLAGLVIGGSILNCLGTGGVIATGDNVGGLIGHNNSGTISNCYAVGTVSGSTLIGGLVGCDSTGSYKSSFWDTDINPDVNGIGNGKDPNVIGKTTGEMQTKSTFTDAGWDFVGERANGTNEVWKMPAGDGYPVQSRFNGYVPPELPGEGTLDQPYLISDANGLGAIYHCESSACYRLVADINLWGITWSAAPIPVFFGLLDGAGHTINNLHIEGAGFLGLIGTAWAGAEIKNLIIVNADVDAGKGYDVGGMVGFSKSSNISNCYSTGSISGGSGVGGLAGGIFWGRVSRCCASGSVSGDDYVGGLVGSSDGNISNCYAASSVTAREDAVGGLVGYNYQTILNCYANGSVSADGNVGGLVGYDQGGYYTKCFWDSDVNPDVNGIGNTTDPNVIGKSTAEMQTESTYTNAGWDFVGEVCNGREDIWRMCWDGGWYARLAWQFYEWGDFVCPDRVDLKDFSYVAARFGRIACAESNNCDGADLDYSGIVDRTDVKILTDLWLKGRPAPGELAVPPGADFADYAKLTSRWLHQQCWLTHNCHAADLDFSGAVDWKDLKIFCEHWLEGTE